MNSRQKGARGEREFAAYLRARGVEARRGQQHSGSPDSPDVVHDLPGVHIEVKRVERLAPMEWYAQAVRDAGPEQTPIVAFRRNREDWMVLMSADDYFDAIGVGHLTDLPST